MRGNRGEIRERKQRQGGARRSGCLGRRCREETSRTSSSVASRGLSGFAQALEAVYPKCRVQRGIVHPLRNSLKYVNWKDSKAIAADLKIIYAASTEEAARIALAAFRTTHNTKHSAIGRSWEANWDPLTPFFHFPPEIRKIIYTTNALESLNSSFRKISRHRNLFPTIHSLFKLFYLSLKNISRKWTLTLPNWPSALSHFAIEFENRMPNNL